MILELKTFLIAMTPIGELRASIPIALNVYHLSYFSAFFFSVLGNMLSSAIFLLFLKKFSDYLSKKSYYFNRFLAFILNRTYNRTVKKVQKWQEIALLLFVAIPLPFTGAWTGSLVAFIFGFSYKKSLLFIFFGVLIAGLIVSLLNYSGVYIYNYFGLRIFLISFFLIFIFLFFLSKKNNQ